MDIIHFIESIFKNKTNLVFFELGACDCYHSKIIHNILLNNNNTFKYYAFELVKKNYEIALQQITGYNIDLYNLAISNKTELKKEFYFSDNPKYYGSSSINKPYKTVEYWADMTFSKSICNTITLDDFCEKEKINHIDFIWADIQGAEKQMIEGGRNILRKNKYIYTEYGKDLYESALDVAELTDLLENYAILFDFGGDVLFKNTNYV
jgi:FkbM family methyltransferase